MRTFSFVLASLFTLAACASEPKRLPPALDPSSPEAPEAPLADLPTTLASTPAPRPSDPHANHGASQAPSGKDDAGTTVYTCPMDPEVRSTTEGRCPKCGMKLVPEKKPAQQQPSQTPPSGHEQHGGHGAHP
ncbi:hypothetical protein LY474_31290 [Myxococcus stipitatus]|uniref:heavy metal-binding domain-containing protein n=1 Tax=Myxococcus stipitatus TaxID=83455 RepID=UPI001F363F92|nr:heavy metal-binding domain-containing protein [Myxococcus stipitatus]MCE9672301.1 hypothetical protein [Myxococcus stipitatus]